MSRRRRISARWRVARLQLKAALAPARRAALEQMKRARRRLDAIDIPLTQLQWILLLYIVCGLLYAFSTPIFEAHDEIWHFGFVQRLRSTGELPRQVFDGKDTIYAQHGSQPPLYYGLMALLTAPFDISDAEDYRQLNPHVARGEPDSWGNKNLTMRDPTLNLWRGTGLAVTVMRLIGLAFGAGTIALVHRIGTIVAPQRSAVAFAAAAITAFNPMFIFISASVTNDSLAMLFNAALILLLLQGFRFGLTARRSLAISLLFAISCLTKLTSLALLPAMLVAAALIWWRRRDSRKLFLYLGSVALIWLLIAGWWFARNWQLYGEPSGMAMMANIAGPRGPTFDLGVLAGEFQHFRMSYWGIFGAQNIQLAAPFYLLLDLATFLGFIGCGFLILQLLAISDFGYARYELANLATLLCAVLAVALGALVWSTQTRVADGRILFPLIAAVSPVIAVGLVEIVWWTVFSLRPPNLEFVRAGDAVPKHVLHDAMRWQLRLLGIAAMLAPLTVIASQYGLPTTVPDAPPNARPVYAEFGDVALLAYERTDRRYSPGDSVRVTLFWRALSQSSSDNTLLLNLVDDHNQSIGRYVTFPGAGKLRTSTWHAGSLYRDEYAIPIHAAAAGRYPFSLRVEWANLPADSAIAATNAEGERIAPVLLDIGAVVSARIGDAAYGFIDIPTDSQPLFDDWIRLERYFVDAELNELVLGWKTDSAPDDNYTVFAHLVDADGALLAQADAAPRLPTRYWRWGETYQTHHLLPADLPLLDYFVRVGWYLNDGAGLPRLEYFHEPEAAEDAEAAETGIYLDAYDIPWDILRESLRLTEEAELTAAAPPEATEASDPTS